MNKINTTNQIFPEENLPPKFYKYKSMGGSEEAQGYIKDIICNHKIYFSPPIKFNDPFDCRPVISLDAPASIQNADYKRLQRKLDPLANRESRRIDYKEFRRDPNRNPNNPNVRDSIQKEIVKHHSTEVGVLSVSTKRDNVLMWSHYAGSHQGICLEFDGNFAFMAHAMKVKYAEKRPIINVYIDDKQTQLEKALLTKSLEWKYEDEWRLISYEKGSGVFEFRPKNLTGLIFGAQANERTISTIKEWLSERELPVRTYRAEVCQSTYTLKIVDDI
jgi:hypothetical protein